MPRATGTLSNYHSSTKEIQYIFKKGRAPSIVIFMVTTKYECKVFAHFFCSEALPLFYAYLVHFKYYRFPLKCACGTVNAPELEPDHPIHWYNGALASYFLEDYEEALQATTRALELLPHNKQVRALTSQEK